MPEQTLLDSVAEDEALAQGLIDDVVAAACRVENWWDALIEVLGVLEEEYEDIDPAVKGMLLFQAGAEWRSAHPDTPVPGR